MTTPVPTAALNSGAAMPQIGFGVFLVEPGVTQKVVEDALDVGYRHIDTATGYDNEAQVGAALKASGIRRDEMFVTTKLLNADHREGNVEAGFENSLRLLGLDAVDLYLVHWPMPANRRYVDTWEQFVAFSQDGRATSIGVSNFQIDHLNDIIRATGVSPAVNQIEFHPLFQQPELRAYHLEHGIVTESWGPLGQGKTDIFERPAIVGPARSHGVTPAQVILRWHVQLGNVAIPKSSSRARMIENLDVAGFELSDTEMAAIAALDENLRVSRHPDDVN
ncbi:MAG TPA: aldo/keto reductase [Pseudolysinimonas sp.]|jgi:2,5-diketo-D-gluconate reductase A